MTTSGTIKRRLLSLERSANINRTGIMEQIQQAALKTISDDDLQHLREFVVRGASLSKCTPEEKAALERYEAALRIASRT